MNAAKNSRTGWGMGGAVGAAIAASACCTVPFVLVSLGIGGAWVSTLTALEPFRPYFIALAVGFLGFAGYRLYQQSRLPDCDCDDEAVPLRTRQVLLGVAALLTLGLIASPQLLPEPSSGNGVPGQNVSLSPTMQVITLAIEGMTCDGCAATVAASLSRLDGVENVNVTYVPPQATVLFDTSALAAEDLIEATTSAGYSSYVITEQAGP